MANPEHLAILKQGVEVWNKWREENGGINFELRSPYLGEADLSFCDLSGFRLNRINFSEADLRSSILIETDLSIADLNSANLNSSNLSKADLGFAVLSSADLGRANLNETDLRGADLRGANLKEANLSSAKLDGAECSMADLQLANLSEATLRRAILNEAKLCSANLNHVEMTEADLSEADLSGAFCDGADLRRANLSKTKLNGASLIGANLIGASLLETNLNNANIEGAKVYGISAWNIEKKGLIQKDLVITRDDEPKITVDDLEMAQFIYLMLNNEKIRNVIDTLTSKAVLILGRFSEERKPLLDAIREELRRRNYLPILFDFDKPASRNLTETISILAKMSRFVIADLTDARSIPQELSHIVPSTPSLPVIPMILEGQREYAMFEHFKAYPWVMPLYAYATPEAMLAEITEKIIKPAERQVVALRTRENDSGF